MKKKLLFFYIVFLLSILLFSYLFIDYNLPYFSFFYTGFYTNFRQVTTLLFCLFLGIGQIVYIHFFRYFSRDNSKKKYLRIAFFTIVLLAFSYPAIVSYDIFNYIATAKITFFYHENPYIVMPNEFLGDPMLLFMHAPNKTALYGPIWILLTGIPYVIGNSYFILTLFLFKFIVILFLFLTLFVIYKLTEDIYPVLLFTFNPLVILETVISGHNDIVMMSLALSGFYLLKKNKVALGLLILLLSILIKYATLILLPIYVFYAYRKITKKEIHWHIVFSYCFSAMLFMFFISTFREEIYPWYAVWFFVFTVLTKNKMMLYFSFILSFSVLFRHVPYMYWGMYDQRTAIVKTIITFVPVSTYCFYAFFKKFQTKK